MIREQNTLKRAGMSNLNVGRFHNWATKEDRQLPHHTYDKNAISIRTKYACMHVFKLTQRTEEYSVRNCQMYTVYKRSTPTKKIYNNHPLWFFFFSPHVHENSHRKMAKKTKTKHLNSKPSSAIRHNNSFFGFFLPFPAIADSS